MVDDVEGLRIHFHMDIQPLDQAELLDEVGT
jgi:hypothetical protein